MSAIDFSRSRAILVGTSHYTAGLAQMDAAANSLAEMQALLTGPLCGWPGSRVTLLLNSRTRDGVDQQIATLIHDTADVLLFYYVGHGQLLDGEDLGMALVDTHRDPRMRYTTSLRLSHLRHELKYRCPARVQVVILDCCFAGLATRNTQGAGLAEQVRQVTKVEGAYTLAASRASQKALHQDGRDGLTYFTKILTEVVHGGIPGAGPHLTLNDLHTEIAARFRHLDLPEDYLRPEPTTLAVDTAEELPLAHNTAWTPPHATGEPPAAKPAATAGPRSPLPAPPAPAAPPIDAIPPGRTHTWQAQRVRTGGVDCIVRVSNGAEKHTVEYRSRPDHRAVVLLDGHRVYHGPCQLDCEFTLGRRGSRARLRVTDEPDIQLWVDHTQVYALRQAAPDSGEFLEQRAAAIRAVLLAGFVGPGLALSVTPDIGRRDLRAVRATLGRSARLVTADPVIGVATVTGRGQHRVWFTERALHIQTPSGLSIMPYDELAAATVASEGMHKLKVENRAIEIPYARTVATVINAVKTAVVYQDTGIGVPPPVHLFSGTRASHPENLVGLVRWLVYMTTAMAALVTAQGTQMNLDAYGWYLHFTPLIAGSMIGLAASALFASTMLTVSRVKASFGLTLSVVAVFTAIVSVFTTWAPHTSGDPPPPPFGWSLWLGDCPLVAFGNAADIAALGPVPRIVGTLLVAAAVFLLVVGAPTVRRRRMRRTTAW